MATSVTLLVGDSQLEIIPQEGAVLAKFQSHGEQFLAQTPWAEAVVTSAAPAPDEPRWVENWRGAPTEVGAKRSTSTADFTRLSVHQPAKVFALAHPQKKTISIEVGEWVARVEWEGLDHALIWQEFGTSTESPWNSQVFALGIEPTNVAHGLGANDSDGPFLSAGQTITWKTSLQLVRKVDDSFEERT